MNDDERFKKWQSWIRTIKDDFQPLCNRRHIFDEVFKMVNSLGMNESQIFGDYMRDTYAAYAFMTVRRQLKGGKESISFKSLLDELQEYPTVLSVEQYLTVVKHQPKSLQDGCEKRFREEWTVNGCGYLSSEIPKDDLEELKNITEKIESIADKRIAHHDKKEIKEWPKFEDLNRAIATLEDLVVKYLNVLLGESRSKKRGLKVTVLDKWKKIFEKPWLTPPSDGD